MNQSIKLSPTVLSILDKLPKNNNGDWTKAKAMIPAECYTSEEFFEFERTAVFERIWMCVGRQEQIPNPGDFLAPNVAGEPLLVVRGEDGAIRAMSAICQHRGNPIACEPGSAGRLFRCPYHFWTYDLQGHLVGAPRMSNVEELRAKVKLPAVRSETWHGFIFVNLDGDAAPLAPSLAKLEPFWSGYEDENVGLTTIPAAPFEAPLPWNWKIHAENFTDAYHPEFVHRGTHDFAPSNLPDGGGVESLPFEAGDNAIVRNIPLLHPDGGMMKNGWGEDTVFPAIKTLSTAQRNRLTFALMPPTLTLVFAPGAVAYQLVSPIGAHTTLASNDRITAGGWLLPKSTAESPDFAQRAAAVKEGASKIWAQDLPINIGSQLGKASMFAPNHLEENYSRLEATLMQFNMWLLQNYQAGWAAISHEANR